MFIRFTEINDWEGETWHRFVEKSKLTDRLVSLINSWNEKIKDGFDIGLSYKSDFTEKEVESFVSHSSVGYMAKYDIAKIDEVELHNKEGVDIDKAIKEEDYESMTINYKMSMFKR